jgi:hypothetical protein
MNLSTSAIVMLPRVEGKKAKSHRLGRKHYFPLSQDTWQAAAAQPQDIGAIGVKPILLPESKYITFNTFQVDL